MEKQEEIKEKEIQRIEDMLFAKYGTFKLSKKQTAFVVGISTSTLDRQRKAGVGIRYQQDTETSNIYYRTKRIAEHIVLSDIQTI